MVIALDIKETLNFSKPLRKDMIYHQILFFFLANLLQTFTKYF